MKYTQIVCNTEIGDVHLRSYSEKTLALSCLKILLSLCGKLDEVYIAGLTIREFGDTSVQFRIEFTEWEVFETLITPKLAESHLECVIERRTADYSYGGEVWVRIKVPEAIHHVMHTIKVSGAYLHPRKTMTVEQLVEKLRLMINALE